MERNKKLLSLLIFFLPVSGIFFIFREVIFSAKIFSHLDVLLTFVPYYSFLSHGTSVLSQSILSGFPVYVSTNSSWFNPLNNLLFNFMDAVDTFRFLDVLYLVLAYTFSYVFMRRIKVGHLASILGAAIFIFAGQVMLWSETIIITNYYFLMPLCLYLLDVAAASRWFKAFCLYVLLGIFLGWGWLSGHVQFLIYIHTLVCVYFLFLLWHKYKSSSYKVIPWFDVMLFIVVLGISFAVGFSGIHAILNFLPLTARASGVTLDAATAYAYTPYHLIYYLLPSFKVPYLSFSQSFQNYIGILPLLLFLTSFFVWKELRTNKYFNFFFSVFIFCFVASVKYSPIAYILHNLPFYSSFRETFRVMFIGDFALAICIAISMGYIWDNRQSISSKLVPYMTWTKRGFLYFILPVTAVLSLTKIFFFESIENLLRSYFHTHLYSKTVGGFPPEHYYSIINSYLHQSIDQFFIFNSGMLIFFTFSIASYLLLKNIKFLTLNTFLIFSIITTVLNFAAFYAYRIQGISKTELLTHPKTAEFIKNKEKGGDPFRIFSPLMDVTMFNASVECGFPDLGNWDVSRQDFALRRELIEPDLSILYGMDSADGYDPYVPVRTSEMIGYVGSRFSTTDNHSISGEKLPLNLKIEKLIERKNIYRVMNVKYILTLFTIIDADFTLAYSEEVGACKSKLYIYELKNTFPRYFLTDKVVTVPKNESFVLQMQKLSLFDTPTILIEKDDQALTQDAITGFVQNLTVSSMSGDAREFTVSAAKNSYFFFGEALLPGWVATVDGKEETLLRANYIYAALPITKGEHEIKLEYKR